MAGVSAVQYGRMPGEKSLVAPQPVGTKFLASSHFTISQDNSVTKGSLKSIFKKDYVPWEINSKPDAAKPPRPAAILQKDDRYFNERSSETKQQYEYHDLPKPELRDISHTLGATNFKMDADHRLNSFQTTHNLDYTPKQCSATLRGVPKQKPMESFIPQGDRDKAAEPMSDYKDRYRGHDISSATTIKVPDAHQGSRATILGDERQHHFRTTHSDTYRGNMLPKLASYPAPRGSSIPQGDQQKEKNMRTTHQTSYPAHDMSALTGYDKNAVMGKLRETNFKQGDGHGSWNNYLSTMTESYQPIVGEVDRSRPGRHRNHSDFPTGDDDPFRNADRANVTTNRFYFSDPPEMQRPHIASGAQERTKSQVVFGEPSLAGQYYDTTTDSTYKPTKVPYTYHRSDNNTKSAVPVHYYPDEEHHTTYHSDFIDPETGKTIPNPTAIAKLKESHIRAPLGGLRLFSTEHLEQYTPKEADIGRAADAGRLQKSSVPLGTLNG